MGFATGDFAGYRLGEELGRGGMGVVLAATHLATGRPVALKLILGARDPEARARFAREVRALTTVRHPGVVTLLDAGEHEGTPYLAMELLDGGSLRERLRAGPLEPAAAAALLAEVARAVHAAHEAELVHRDLKPANVLFDRAGRPKVADFGLVRVLFGAERLTQTGTVLGTPHYLAPEQLGASQRVDRRADVYALGAILFETLTGEPPYAHLVPPTLWDRILHGAVPSAREHRREVPRALDALCRRALSKDPAARPSTALDLALELERVGAAPRRGRRGVLLAVGVAGLAGGLAATSVVVGPPSGRSVTPSPAPSASPADPGSPGDVAPAVSRQPFAGEPTLDPGADDPSDDDAFGALLRGARFDEALALADADAATDPRAASLRRARALLGRAALRREQGDEDERLADLQAAVDALRDGDGVAVSRLRARVFEELEQWELAAYAQVDVVARGGAPAEARELLLTRALANALRAHPDAGRTSFFEEPAPEAVVLTAADGVLRAVADWAADTRVAGPANVALARALHARGADPVVVRGPLDRATKRAPSDPGGWVARAEWHAARGDAESAGRDLRQAQELTRGERDPLRDALLVQVEVLRMLERGDRNGAAASLALVANLVPEHPLADAAARLHQELVGRRPPAPALPHPPPPGAAPPARSDSFFAPPWEVPASADAVTRLRDLARAAAGTETGVTLTVALARMLHVRGEPADEVLATLDAAAATGDSLALLARAEWHAAHDDARGARADLERAGTGKHPVLAAYVEGLEAMLRGDRPAGVAAFERAATVVGPFPIDPHLVRKARLLQRRLREGPTDAPSTPAGIERLKRLDAAFKRALRDHASSQPSFFQEPGGHGDPVAAATFARLADEAVGTFAEPVVRVALARALHALGAGPERVEEALEAAVNVAPALQRLASRLARAEWAAAQHDVERARAELQALRGALPAHDEELAGWFRRLELYVAAVAALEHGRRADAAARFKRLHDHFEAEEQAGRQVDGAMWWRAARSHAELTGGPPPVPKPPAPR